MDAAFSPDAPARSVDTGRPVDAGAMVDMRPVDAGRPADAAAVPTFTQLYKDYFGAMTVRTPGREVPGCQGTRPGECHSITSSQGEQHSFSTRDGTYQLLVQTRGYALADDERSRLLQLLEEGTMPMGGPRMPEGDVARIRACGAAAPAPGGPRAAWCR